MSKAVRLICFALNDHFYNFVHDWKHKFYFLVGGYGSSKSYHIAVKLIKKLLEEKRTALVVREVFDTLRDSCYSLLEEVALAMGFDEKVIKFTESPMRVKFANGSKIIFKGMDKPAKLKSLNGVSIVWIEECSEVKYEGFKEITGRLRHPYLSNHIILSTNPVSKGNWCYKHFFQDKRNNFFILNDEELYKKRIVIKNKTYYHHSTVDDNFFVPEDYIESLDELKLHDEDLWRIARKGRFGVNGKLVLPNFEIAPLSEVMKDIKAIKKPLLKNGMDFGFVTSYNALLRMAIDHEEKILYIYYEYYTRDKTDIEIAEDIKEFKESGELIKADCAEPKAIKFYKQAGFRMKACKKFQGSRAMYTKKVKRFKKIICADICTNTINELQDLTFKVDKDGEIIEDEFNIDPHTLSAIWYGLDDYEVSNLKGGGLKNFGH
ncbi:PBSX family phage terminase large subunit [Clostridium botulinum]|uniref:PBSX family phage terminase large subunit n=1 Tax=Clostridium botulinum TaxID=1491 RepID=UPI002248327F|nr:PBSX family phage terminase large subunit [Clostridium botulinum]UZP02302.1 PBSX family phage terminase large subunit [Clostridium botulinum]UZP05661.1 PBSX family phage terminase large subunit [Clostridium botulinum]UZP09041.1 PBSX family phage terminase large subunit [Clostridium botulinum]